MPRKNFLRKKSATYQRPAPHASGDADTCWSTGKKRYHTEKEGSDAADIAELQRGITLDVYRCELCGSWHLTSNRQASK